MDTLWVQFAVAALLIVFAGAKLTKYGDILSEKLNLGHAFVGAVLIGWSTSLPELVLSIGTSSNLLSVGKPNITMGNVLGSNLFNIFILVLLDIYYWKGPILRTAGPKVKISVFLSLMMVTVVGVFLCLQSMFTAPIAIPVVTLGLQSVVIFGVYALCMVALYFMDKKEDSGEQANKYDDVRLVAVFGRCLLVATVIVAAGLWLSDLAEQIQGRYGLEEGFVGCFFLAIISSLPEVITCFVAVRMGFHSMAIGTLFGSNIFNMGIISFCDLFYTKGNIFPVFTHEHLSSVVFVLLMTLVTMYILSYKKDKKAIFVGFESIVIAFLYLAALYCVYKPSILNSVWKMVGFTN